MASALEAIVQKRHEAELEAKRELEREKRCEIERRLVDRENKSRAITERILNAVRRGLTPERVAKKATSGNRRCHFACSGVGIPMSVHIGEIVAVANDIVQTAEFDYGRVYSVSTGKTFYESFDIVFTWNPNDRDILTKPEWWQSDHGWRHWYAFKESQLGETNDVDDQVEGAPSAPGGPG